MNRYGTGRIWASISSPSLVLLLNIGLLSRELRETLAEMEWFMSLSFLMA
jgi:hypothetical protein